MTLALEVGLSLNEPLNYHYSDYERICRFISDARRRLSKASEERSASLFSDATRSCKQAHFDTLGPREFEEVTRRASESCRLAAQFLATNQYITRPMETMV